VLGDVLADVVRLAFIAAPFFLVCRYRLLLPSDAASGGNAPAPLRATSTPLDPHARHTGSRLEIVSRRILRVGAGLGAARQWGHLCAARARRGATEPEDVLYRSGTPSLGKFDRSKH
jgi:hypothetical protein